MVKLNAITTKVGDNGTTNLAGTTDKYPKSAELFELIGTLDELNSVIGLAIASTDINNTLLLLQQKIFDIGADVATVAKNKPVVITEEDINDIGESIQIFNKSLKPLTSFILPQGSFTTCYLHLARAVCRRAERSAWYLFEEEANVSKEICVYLNRISDLLFVLARTHNEEPEHLWEPNENN